MDVTQKRPQCLSRSLARAPSENASYPVNLTPDIIYIEGAVIPQRPFSELLFSEVRQKGRGLQGSG